jgi:hypothetical protein
MRPVFIADDGEQFLSEQECLDHESALRMSQKIRDLTAFLYAKCGTSEEDCEEAATAILQRYELVEKGERQSAAKQPDTDTLLRVIFDAQLKKPSDIVTGTSNWAGYMAAQIIARALLGKEAV